MFIWYRNTIAIHAAYFVAAFALLPLGFVILSVVRRKTSGKSTCTSCGYNLTGNISGVCPECGTTVAAQR
jgi:hypothetical protein